MTRACLKKAFRELRVSVCGRFYPNEGGVAGYGNRMRVKYTAKWGLQIAEMIFQTRSRAGNCRKSGICRQKFRAVFSKTALFGRFSGGKKHDKD